MRQLNGVCLLVGMIRVWRSRAIDRSSRIGSSRESPGITWNEDARGEGQEPIVPHQLFSFDRLEVALIHLCVYAVLSLLLVVYRSATSTGLPQRQAGS